MKQRKFRKLFWWTLWLCRYHTRKVKPLPGTYWVGNTLKDKK